MKRLTMIWCCVNGLMEKLFTWMQGVIKKKYGQDATNVGDEGGFAPNIQVLINFYHLVLLSHPYLQFYMAPISFWHTVEMPSKILRNVLPCSLNESLFTTKKEVFVAHYCLGRWRCSLSSIPLSRKARRVWSCWGLQLRMLDTLARSPLSPSPPSSCSLSHSLAMWLHHIVALIETFPTSWISLDWFGGDLVPQITKPPNS